MTGLESLGRLLVLMGVFAFLLGILFILAPKAPYLGRLPGDIFLHKGNFTLYFPLVTMVLASVGLTIVLNLVLRIFRG